jgi:hypothetical protein
MILDMFKELEDQSFDAYQNRRKIAGRLIAFGSACLVWTIIDRVYKRK